MYCSLFDVCCKILLACFISLIQIRSPSSPPLSPSYPAWCRQKTKPPRCFTLICPNVKYSSLSSTTLKASVQKLRQNGTTRRKHSSDFPSAKQHHNDSAFHFLLHIHLQHLTLQPTRQKIRNPPRARRRRAPFPAFNPTPSSLATPL